MSFTAPNIKYPSVPASMGGQSLAPNPANPFKLNDFAWQHMPQFMQDVTQQNWNNPLMQRTQQASQQFGLSPPGTPQPQGFSQQQPIPGTPTPGQTYGIDQNQRGFQQFFGAMPFGK